tara:strand:- start:172 stop:351 length:180 start_codon:yes stop_codon:yes gene_type:complete
MVKNKEYKKADEIEDQLSKALDKLEKIKKYRDIGLTLALRIKTNKDILLLKKRLSKELN